MLLGRSWMSWNDGYSDSVGVGRYDRGKFQSE